MVVSSFFVGCLGCFETDVSSKNGCHKIFQLSGVFGNCCE